jgi:hypothetical protein
MRQFECFIKNATVFFIKCIENLNVINFSIQFRIVKLSHYYSKSLEETVFFIIINSKKDSNYLFIPVRHWRDSGCCQEVIFVF